MHEETSFEVKAPALPALPIGRYRFTLRADAPFKLTGYPGAMLRGAWGHALRQLACSTGQPQCQGCPVRASCRYTRLFEPQPEQTRDGARDIPPPYIVEAPLSQPRLLQQGDTWSFDIVLFGEALSELPLVIWAWQRAARAGLGEQRTPMTLMDVYHEQADAQCPIWQSSGGLMPQLPRVAIHTPELRVNSAMKMPPPSSAELTFVTPTRLQSKGRICEPHDVNTSLLLSTLWRKLMLYLTHYASLTPPLMPSTAGILLQPTSLTRQRWERHSQRQKNTMRLDGMLGTLSLHGNLDDWWPWLWLGQYTHLGKNTSFGLGQYRLASLG